MLKLVGLVTGPDPKGAVGIDNMNVEVVEVLLTEVLDLVHLVQATIDRDLEHARIEARSETEVLRGAILSLTAESSPEVLRLISFVEFRARVHVQDLLEASIVKSLTIRAASAHPSKSSLAAIRLDDKESLVTIEQFTLDRFLLNSLRGLTEGTLNTVHATLSGQLIVELSHIEMWTVVHDKSISEEFEQGVVLVTHGDGETSDFCWMVLVIGQLVEVITEFGELVAGEPGSYPLDKVPVILTLDIDGINFI